MNHPSMVPCVSSVENSKKWGFILVKSTQGAGLIGDEAFYFRFIILLPKGLVSIRGFSGDLNSLIIFWAQIAT